MAFHESNLIWLDLEMTGLEPSQDRILEIATVVTDSELNVLAEGPVIAVHQSDEVLAGMDEWCTNQHGNSGLTERVRKSKHSEEMAIRETIAFLEKWVPKGVSPMCGNSIGQDRRFLNVYMRELEDYFHYRNIDVSSIKELVRRWSPDMLNLVKKQGTHLALDDIRESIAELRVYRQNIFKI
ncbi:MAG: oligoribonuclease [Pseudomonadota bacterium]|uniref:Oligoribonuclease n=1 Tax=Pseudoalteromonas spongiae TaxID=298657 RepID=A0ABU8ENF7_9GAMM|nr:MULTISPECIES: oligoribonuclease [Pseudoalteromonas]ATC97684.1 oligoribonuclease [Pseudoalteromonas spongiae UST010723-006]KPV96590.1 Oligoribonuclease [Pseudoalteromonas sp. P1-9]MEC8325710.1 oligoribonuclease [Pseudomonadota bacterium]TMO81782.1 oligoribonuclease [Pseudoalteromonas spongiae]|tara:strand:- start:154 stop:699 length:546 start_codon:yes stop_codon:yes gene_type:complete